MSIFSWEYYFFLKIYICIAGILKSQTSVFKCWYFASISVCNCGHFGNILKKAKKVK